MASEKGTNGYIDREASKLPYVRCKFDGGVVPVKMGVVGWLFVIATLTTIGGATVYANHMVDDEANEKNIKVLNRNIGQIDEQQRVTDQSVKYMVQQVQALIDADPDVVGPSKLPTLETSKLEALE